ncbi:ATPase domain-containing protein [Opitutus sp. ER46]|uniref:ATPase domain-containing protein n=1 Tax=Opitutus sp. ER46 TaxID=2161864 RepID=UPI000D31FD68|nr:ATPase domain-containing protein [Opitutus sp. ER46]PTY01085.1 circadian clock protein KaiC [Opitutus sp. ER46]
MNAPPSSIVTPVLEDERCPTGVAGLDEILHGGLPRNCFYLVQGDPGSGKTTLALQFLLEGVRRGEAGFYITLSETKRELTKVAASHGWSLEGVPLLEMSAIEGLLRADAQTTVFGPSEVELGQVSALLLGELHRLKPVRVVFDSLSEFRLIAETPLRYRRQLLTLKQEFAAAGSTVLLLDDKMETEGIGADPHVLSLTHGVIDMEQLSPDYGASRRRLRVRKLRGVKFREGYHDYTIARGGVRVFPRLSPAEFRIDHRPEPLSSGIPELDAMLGGGLDRGTTTLVLGAAGTGKSTAAMQYVVTRAEAGERGLIFTFDETRGVLLNRARALGLNFAEQLEQGRIDVQQVDPAELSPGEFAMRVREGVEAGAQVVVIDSLNGYLNAMPGERFLNNQLHELCSYLNQKQVLTILILAQQGLVAAADTPVDVSYLADTVLTLRYFEVAGSVKQAIAVVKKRSGRHEKTIREFKLESGRGVRVGAPLTEFQGILGGVPVFRGSPELILPRPDERNEP